MYQMAVHPIYYEKGFTSLIWSIQCKSKKFENNPNAELNSIVYASLER